MGRNQLDKFMQESTPDTYNVVFITEPGNQVISSVPLYCKDYIPVWFHDVCFPIGSYAAPKKEDIEQILAWSELRNEPFVVACAAGVSRSSATALLITYQKTKSIDEALAILNPDRHNPNALIVKMGSEILNCPELYTRYSEWMNGKIDGWCEDVKLEIIE